jgi:peptide deformylase
MVTILQSDNPILRKKAKEVPLSDIGTKKFEGYIRDMQTALHGEDDGVAIAAPQIGLPLRIFIVSGKIFDKNFLKAKGPIKEPLTGWPDDVICINPTFIKMSKQKVTAPEGCLSVRWLYGDTKRAKNATIEAYDIYGKKFTRGGGGLLAQIFQHEMDHLDGILFIDHAKNIEEILPKHNEETE